MTQRKLKKHRLAVAMGVPIWCSLCHVRIAPYEIALRFVGVDAFHLRCLQKIEQSAPRAR